MCVPEDLNVLSICAGLCLIRKGMLKYIFKEGGLRLPAPSILALIHTYYLNLIIMYADYTFTCFYDHKYIFFFFLFSSCTFAMKHRCSNL